MADTNNGFGPIVYRRDNRKTCVMFARIVVIIFGLFILGIYRIYRKYMSRSDDSFCSWCDAYTFAYILFSIMLREIIRRICLFAEEIRHVNERYSGSMKEAFLRCLSSRGWECPLIFVFLLVVCVKSWYSDGTCTFPFALCIIAGLGYIIFEQLLNGTNLSPVEVSELIESDNRNVFEGLAWAYYFNYLKHVLPKFGDVFEHATRDDYQLVGGGDIREHVKDKRLYVVIPKDGYCYKTMDEWDPKHISVVPERLPMDDARGFNGGAKRSYLHTLYKVSVDDLSRQPKYVVMEYASPLLTLYDMSQRASTNFTEENRMRQIVSFYNKLKEILDADHDCRGKYKLLLTGPGIECKGKEQKGLGEIVYNTTNNE